MDSSVFAPAAEAEAMPGRWPLREDVFARTGGAARGKPEDVSWRAEESEPAGQEIGGLEAERQQLGGYELELEAYGSLAEDHEFPPDPAEGWDHEDELVAGGGHPGYLCVPHVPLLASHRGNKPDLILRWNVSSAPEVIDVVVHLHGNSRPRLRLDRDVLPYSGLDLAPVGGAAGSGRSRPTLAVLPRGHDTGTKQASPPYFNRYAFPALITRNGLTDLVHFSLDCFAAQVGGEAPRCGRLILTAHSAGGRTMLELLKHHDPQQLHVFDALYQSPAALVTWALRHIQQDRAALAGLDAAAASQYMATRGGALRVFYQARVKDGTRTWSGKVRDAIAAELDPALARWYRVEASRYDHFQIPRRYGWRVLAAAGADVPDAYAESATHHQAERWEPAFELATPEELEAPWAATEQEAFEGEAFEAEGFEAEGFEAEGFEGEFQEETEGEFQGEEELEAGEREGLLTHASEEALARLEPLAAEAEALGPDEEGPAGRSWSDRLLEQSVLVAAIAAGQRSESVLTNRLFRLRHPEDKDKPIAEGDEGARAERRQIRDRQVVPLLLTGPFIGPMHDWLAFTPAGTDLRKGVPEGAVLSPLSITRRGLRKARARQPGTIAAIVVHNTSRGPANKSREGGYRRSAIEYALDYYLNGKEGFPHYVVDFNGTIYATCDERFVASHAGWIHAGRDKLFRSGWTAPDWWSRVWSRQGAATPIDLLPKGARSPNYRTIGIELLLLPDMSYTPQQYKALARLIVDIQRRNPDLQIPQAPSRALLGHEDFAPVTATGGRADAHGGWDPGAHRDRPFFDWQWLWSEIQALGGKGAEAPESLEAGAEAGAEAEAEGREEAEEEAGEELEDQLEVIAAEELAEPELGEMEAFLGELLEAQAGPGTVTFPSGQILPVVAGPIGAGQEHYDPNGSGNPLLDTGTTHRATRLSRNFTVGELARSGTIRYDTARIDPGLVRCLQALQDHVGKPVTITSGYRSYLYNRRIYQQRNQKPTDSQHSSGRAADVRIQGMSGLAIAKAALTACGLDLGLGVSRTFAHIDVRGRFAVWTYLGKGEEDRQAIAAVTAHRRQLAGGPAAGPATAPAATPAVAPANTYIRIAGDITAAFESGGDVGKLNLYDNGVISYGRHQATLAGGNLHLVMARFVELSRGEVAQALRGYLDRLKAKDRSLKHDERFIGLLKQAATLPEMRQAQDEVFRQQYWEPTARRARSAKLTSALGYALLYDSQVQGPVASKYRFEEVRKRLGGVVGDPGPDGKPITELAFLRAWVEARKASALRNSEQNLIKATQLDARAAELEAQAGRADPDSATKLRAEAAKLRERATENRKNAEALKISATRTRGVTWQALVDVGDLDLRGDEHGLVRLAGKKGVAIPGLKPGATIE
jgi:hypothetical protein